MKSASMWRSISTADVGELEELWLEALKQQNLTVLDELLHEQFTSTSARSIGEVIRKKEYLAAATQLQVCDYDIADQVISAIEDVAVVKQRLSCHSKYQELDIHDDLLVTDVWVKSGDRWVAITRHASHLPF
jgi:hypothetical protein